MSGPERRRHPRHRRDAPLILIQQGEEGSREGATLRDVSLGGLAFETSLRLTQGDMFDFALYVPGRGWVDGAGRVCWTKRSGDRWLCGATITIREWNQARLMRKWLDSSSRGLLRFFFPEKGTPPPPED